MPSSLELNLDRNLPQPIYRQIEDQLRMKILGGELPPGSCLPNGQELSRDLGVAYRTVIRSLNRLKKEGLLRGVPSRGTFVEAVHGRQVQNIAIVFDRGYLQTLAREVERFQRGIMAACDNRLQLQLFPLPDATIFSAREPTLLARMIEDWHIQGVITYSAPPPADIDRLGELRIPTVTTRDIYPDSGAPWVMEDVEDGAHRLINFLVAGLGHRRIGLVLGPRPADNRRILRPSAILATSLLRELQAHGIACRPEWVLYSDFRWPSVSDAFGRMLGGSERPTAVIFAEDIMATEGIKAAAQMNLSVPRDLSIASYGDFLSPDTTLTAVHLPMEEMARRAVQYMERLIQGETPAVSPLPVELAIRQTCGSAPQA